MAISLPSASSIGKSPSSSNTTKASVSGRVNTLSFVFLCYTICGLTPSSVDRNLFFYNDWMMRRAFVQVPCARSSGQLALQL